MSPALQSVTLICILALNAPRNTIQANLTLLMDIIHCSEKYHNFENFPILAARKALHDVEDFIVDLHRSSRRPLYILTEKNKVFYFRYHMYRESLVLVFFRGINDMVFERTDILTRGRRLMAVIFILLRPPMTFHEINEIMVHVWGSKYMHAVLLYRDTHGRDHLITFEVYPGFKIRSLIDVYQRSDIFAMRTSGNLHGYKISSPVKFDLPRVFKVTDYRGITQIKGFGYQLFMAFVKYRNATFEEYHVPNTSANVQRQDMIELIADGKIEISLHPHRRLDLTSVGSTYPIRLNDFCVMIPMTNEIPCYMYLRRPFHWSIWILLVFATVYLAFNLMWIPPNSTYSHPKDFGLSLLQSIGYMLNMPTGECYYRVSWNYFFAHYGVWILGFFITTWYCALLESFLTSTVFGPQIDTMDELIGSGLKMLVTQNDLEDLPKALEKIFVETTVDSFTAHRNTFNTSYAYSVSVDRWEFLSLQQQYARRPIFRLSPICFTKHHLVFLVAYDSRLLPSINFFILYAQQSGLLEYWERADFKSAAREGYVRPVMETYIVEPMHTEKMLLAWEVLAIGLGISVAVFVVEVLLVAEWSRRLWVSFAKELRKATGYVRKAVGKIKMWWW